MRTHIQNRNLENKILYRIIILAAVISLILAGFLGMQREVGTLEGKMQELIPDGNEYRAVSNKLFECYVKGNTAEITGYITGATADGFAGPMEVAIFVDRSGTIIELKVVSNKETLSYFEKVIDKKFLLQIKDKSYSDPFDNGNDYDAVSGATWTSKGIADAAARGLRRIAVEKLHLSVPEIIPPGIKFGVPEITLILLYLSVFIGLQMRSGIRKVVRWITLISGMFILGFWFTIPLSVNKINQFLLGYWPEWHTNLYWYMLIFSVFTILFFNKKKLYCNWFCPFRATQDLLALIGGGKVRIPKKIGDIFIIVQRTLVWLVLILALYYRTPSFFNYEIFSTFFALTGTSLMFGLMAIFVIASLFIKRPWCKILCPIEALEDLTLGIRNRIINK